jgi:gas vesicle protein
MKNRKIAIKRGYSWKRPEQQPINQEILHSIERPNVTAVFGTSVPLSGLSGVIRRYAFKHSENSYLHWLPLIMADRVNVVEGLIEDVSKGYVPNIFAERGWKAKWKHNPEGLILDVAIATVLVSALITIGVKRRRNSKEDLEDTANEMGDEVRHTARDLGDAVRHTADDLGHAVKEKAHLAKEKGKEVLDSIKDIPKKVANIGTNGNSKRQYANSGADVVEDINRVGVKYVPVQQAVVPAPAPHNKTGGFFAQLLGAVIPALISRK